MSFSVENFKKGSFVTKNSDSITIDKKESSNLIPEEL